MDLINFSVNDLINLERAMKLGERLDGHLVQGHVDGVAKCLGVSRATSILRIFSRQLKI